MLLMSFTFHVFMLLLKRLRLVIEVHVRLGLVGLVWVGLGWAGMGW